MTFSIRALEGVNFVYFVAYLRPIEDLKVYVIKLLRHYRK